MNVRFLRKTVTINKSVLFQITFILITLLSACREEQKEIVSNKFNPDSSYTMRTTDVSSLISDSGITRYKLITNEWLYFSKAKDPYILFPDGIYIEQFDSLFQTEMTIKADTAYYYEKREFIKLIGNVDITNVKKGERIETSLLYVDQKQKDRTFYSDRFIKITKSEEGMITTGIGFEANQNMEKHRIFNQQGQFEYEEESNDSIRAAAADSTKSTVEKMTPQKQKLIQDSLISQPQPLEPHTPIDNTKLKRLAEPVEIIEEEQPELIPEKTE